MIALMVLLTLLGAGLSPAWAQPAYTYHVLDAPDPDGGLQSRLQLLRLRTDGSILAQGRLANWRIPPDHTQPPEPLTCTMPGFTPEPTAVRHSPLFEGVSETRIVGNHDGRLADGIRRLVGVVREADGTCEAYRAPGAVNTWLTDADEAGNQVGWYDTPLPRNLLRNHGFLRQADGTLLSFNGLGADSALFPESLKGGRVTGYAFTQINPTTNQYVYTAFVCEWTECLPLKTPGGDNLWIANHNEAGYAVAMTANSQRATGGQPWLIHLPSKTFWAIPPPVVPGHSIVRVTVRGISALGWIVGTYTQRLDGCVISPTSPCDTLHSYVAIPNGPLPLPAGGPKKTRLRHLLEWWASKREHLQDWREVHGEDASETRWQPVLRAGHVVLRRGKEVLSE